MNSVRKTRITTNVPTCHKPFLDDSLQHRSTVAGRCAIGGKAFSLLWVFATPKAALYHNQGALAGWTLMDAHNSSIRKGEEQSGFPDQETRDAGHNRRNSTFSHTSFDSYDSALGDDVGVEDLDPLNPEMDSAEIHRRKKAQLVANGGLHGRKEHESDKPLVPNGTKGPESDLSPVFKGEDMEMEELGDEEGLSDDEETGLTKIDKRKRKKRRRTTIGLDARIGGSTMTAKQEQKIADKAVLRSLIINIILIGSWYFFSLSLSIVSISALSQENDLLIGSAVQQVDVWREIPGFPLPFIHDMSTHACAILPRLLGPLFYPLTTPSLRQHHKSTQSYQAYKRLFAARKATHDADVLSYSMRTMWRCYWFRHRPWQYVYENHLTHFLQFVFPCNDYC